MRSGAKPKDHVSAVSHSRTRETSRPSSAQCCFGLYFFAVRRYVKKCRDGRPCHRVRWHNGTHSVCGAARQRTLDIIIAVVQLSCGNLEQGKE